MKFAITDFNHTVWVNYNGLLPDLFREKQGVVVQGKWQAGHFKAVAVLAKHDENYMPPEVKSIIKVKT